MHSPLDIHVCPDAASRRRALAPLSAGLLSLVTLTSLPLGPPAAQVAAPAPQAPASPDIIRQREQELQAAREQQRKAAELQQKLKADIAAIGQDRSKLNQPLIDIATQVRSVETRIV